MNDILIEYRTELATLGVGLIGAVTAIYARRRNALLNASADYRFRVLAALEGLYPRPVNWPKDSFAIDPILRQAFHRLQIAIEQFRPFVPWWKRRAFDRAWFRYRCAPGREQDSQCYHHYMAFDDNPDYKKVFHDNVSKLLSFAKET